LQSGERRNDCKMLLRSVKAGDNIKRNIEKIDLAQDEYWWLAFVNTVPVELCYVKGECHRRRVR
jgi:hypothetical protein